MPHARMTPIRVAVPLLGWPTAMQRSRVSCAAVTLENREDPQRISDHSCVGRPLRRDHGDAEARHCSGDRQGEREQLPPIEVPLRKYRIANQNAPGASRPSVASLRDKGSTDEDAETERVSGEKAGGQRKNGRTTGLLSVMQVVFGEVSAKALTPPRICGFHHFGRSYSCEVHVHDYTGWLANWSSGSGIIASVCTVEEQERGAIPLHVG
jgi:hypothetical protein